MDQQNILTRLPEVLLPWFYQNRRDLPWRRDREPYHIWLSEIMLQQTRVEAVKGYYTRFLTALPTVDALAKAEDELLTKLWEGLGYYSRVRNLKKAALAILQEHGGVFPTDYRSVRALPGIGDYTAGAICSIAYDQKTPAVDGNVLRVYSRLMNDHRSIEQPALKKLVAEELEKVYPDSAGDFTQALMELGATVCGPNRKPDCGNCPCQEFCQGNRKGTAEHLPVKSPKKTRRQEDLTVFVLTCDGRYALEKRPDSGLLADLWQFPNVTGHMDVDQALKQLEAWGMPVTDILRQTEKRHIFTHIQWNMRGFYMAVRCCSEKFQWKTPEQIQQEAALPTAFRQFYNDDREGF